MKNVYRKLLPAFFFSVASFSVCSAVSLSAARLVISGQGAESELKVANQDTQATLVQSWMDAGTEKKGQTLPFVVTPPLFRLEGKSENVVRVIATGSGLPDDRESLFWLNVKAIPAMSEHEKNIKNRVTIAIDNRIKVFYRPESLGTDTGDSIRELHWQWQNGTLTAENSSPYYVVLNKISADSEDVPVSVADNNTVIAPFGKASYTLKHSRTSQSEVSWSAITDLGTVSSVYHQPFH